MKSKGPSVWRGLFGVFGKGMFCGVREKCYKMIISVKSISYM
jgi:hypothetical protein